MQGDGEMSVQALAPPLAPATAHCQRPDSRTDVRARVSTDNPVQHKVNCFKKSDSLSSLTTEMYFSAVELLL